MTAYNRQETAPFLSSLNTNSKPPVSEQPDTVIDIDHDADTPNHTQTTPGCCQHCINNQQSAVEVNIAAKVEQRWELLYLFKLCIYFLMWIAASWSLTAMALTFLEFGHRTRSKESRQ